MSSIAVIPHFTPSTKLTNHSPSLISFPHSLSLSLRLNSISPSLSLSHTHRRIHAISAISPHGSTGNGNGKDFIKGGGNGGKDNNDGSGSGSGNEEEAIMILAQMGRSLESLPDDLADAIGAGKIPGSVVSRFLELEKSPLFKWLLQFSGFRERLLADDLFLAKVGMECGVGIFTKIVAEYERRRENFFNELGIVFADVVMAIIADFMLVWLPAPTISLRAPVALNAGRLAKFFHKFPDGTLQGPMSETYKSSLQKIGATVGNVTKLLPMNTTSSLVSGKDGGSSLRGKGQIHGLHFCCCCHDMGFDTHDAELLRTDLAFLKCLERPHKSHGH
ncbi:protein RETICULATA-RELATED 4, chloroplastic [Heracleum sosnowskyi]|uniref:Protein RETICULATA-RELATED 4, chloroplastic n=1 Tax=Heracleum sosnowskyi TaxID=360622 RepID=A0AAD8IRH0_9APIA|nr:protein RETICULATA-RELATED 4, chloroplastic [Heracleum sosnowskyi]